MSDKALSQSGTDDQTSVDQTSHPSEAKQPRQNTGNHPDPLSEMFEISAADLAGLITHAATASSAAADDNKSRERNAWADFDAITEKVMAQRSPRMELLAALSNLATWKDGNQNVPAGHNGEEPWMWARHILAKATGAQ